MWKSLQEYIRSLGRWGWAVLVGVLLSVAGAVLDVGGVVGFPRWVWATMIGVTLLVAPFIAFHQMRKQRDEARSSLESPSRRRDQRKRRDGLLARIHSDGTRLLAASCNTEEQFGRWHEQFQGWFDQAKAEIQTEISPGAATAFGALEGVTEIVAYDGVVNKKHNTRKNWLAAYLLNCMKLIDKYGESGD